MPLSPSNSSSSNLYPVEKESPVFVRGEPLREEKLKKVDREGDKEDRSKENGCRISSYSVHAML
ncbi:unnamed protein product [Protopolystoma xenopodis]|uniref:Uncharacterized protein n=1 Tax=Protopolystoma xenopodis TaxID=117903 RepID=A0A3S5AZS7_9PLAT|nr:unnamed protein product [Protopolystoma xenopodis]